MDKEKLKEYKAANTAAQISGGTTQDYLPMKQTENLPATKTEQTDLVFIPDEDGFVEGDFSLPWYKLTQDKSTEISEQIKPGMWYNTLTGETKEKLENIVILIRQNGRVLFPEKDFSGRKICWSCDGNFPDVDNVYKKTGKQPQSHRCVLLDEEKQIVPSCQFAKWNKDIEGKTIAPKCNETITLLCMDINTALPFQVSFKSTALAPIKELIKAIALQKKMTKQQSNKKIPLLSAYKITIGITQIGTQLGTQYYIPKIESKTRITDQKEIQIIEESVGFLSNIKMEMETVKTQTPEKAPETQTQNPYPIPPDDQPPF